MLSCVTPILALLLLTAAPEAPEARGRQILSSALDALGGQARLAALDTWLVEGTGRENLTGDLQGLRPDSPTWRPHAEKLAVVRSTGTVAWERRTPRNDESLRWRRLIETPDATGFVDWVTQRGALRPGGTPAEERSALMHRLPHLLLLDAAASATRIAAAGQRSLDAATLDVVEVALPGAPRLTLLFERNPVVLRRVEYPLYLPGLGDLVAGWQWSGWAPRPGIGLAPSAHVFDLGGRPFQEVAYTRYAAGTPDALALAQVPAEVQQPRAPVETPRPPAGFAATGEVAPGVHVANIQGFVVMFVEFADFVVAVEAPEAYPAHEAVPAGGESDRVSREHLALLQRTLPGKPVRYVVVSHHHGDHLGGLRNFVAAGATVLAAPGDVAAVQALVRAPHTLAGDARSLAPPVIETIADRRVISDGTRRLEILNVGANPHTDENLLAWLPAERIAFQGDLFYYQPGAPFPPSGRGTMNRFFARWLAAHGIAPLAVYGVHNQGPAGPDALAQAGG